MAIDINSFDPSVTLLETDFIAQTDDKIRTIIDEAETWLNTETQSAINQLDSEIEVILSDFETDKQSLINNTQSQVNNVLS